MRGLVSKLPSLAEVFKGRHFDAAIIVLCVRWLPPVQTLVPRPRRDDGRTRCLARTQHDLALLQHYTPEFEKRWNRFARPVGGSWRVDETYIKVRGRWV